MASETRITTPVAVLIGSAIIAVGLYFGLRGQAPSPTVPVASGAATVGPAPNVVPAPATAAPAAATAATVQAEAEKALQAQREALLEKCWKPTVAKHPELTVGKLSLNVTFDAQGKQLARGISEQRGAGHPDLTQCVSTTLQPLSIAPPGATVAVEIGLAFP